MAKLNTSNVKVRNKIAEGELTVNHEGAPAYTLNAHKALIESVLGAFWNEDLFYSKGKENSNNLRKAVKAVAAVEPKFVLQTAAYARNVMHMRTTPQVILVEAANIGATKPFIREYAPKIIRRADELSEVIAYQLSQFGKPIPNSLKRGIADAFARFDEYQLNKYDSDKGSVKLGDVLRLVNRKKDYPVSKAMREYLINDVVDTDALPKIGALKRLLAKDTIDEEALSLIKESSVTWETLISKFGSTKENWQLVSPNMGYMALLRNLRNFQEKEVDLAPILERIADPREVARSKQLPFRFFSAYKQVTEQQIRRAIAKAFDASISNVTLDGKTAVLVDMSGSMQARLSSKSSVEYVDVGAVLGAIASKKAADSVFVGFASHVKRIPLNPDDTLMTNVEKILAERNNLGGGTEAHKAFTEIEKQVFDRVILISDMQCYDTGRYNGYYGGITVNKKWEDYVKRNPNSRLYSIDVSAYGTSQTPSNARNVTQLFGWSDKLFDLMNIDEKRDVLEGEIRKV
jgi:60 kDa SS-A/Ro ribonucleoprotein